MSITTEIRYLFQDQSGLDPECKAHANGKELSPEMEGVDQATTASLKKKEIARKTCVTTATDPVILHEIVIRFLDPSRETVPAGCVKGAAGERTTQ